MPTAPSLSRRYLVGFDPKELPHHFTDVLIIGGGIAGCRTALGIPESYRVLTVTKDGVRESNSHYAQGGIAGVLDPDDRFDNHIADTLAAGKGLCDPEVVEMVVREAPKRIGELIDWGTHFDEVDGHVALGREGGHSHARIAHALGDETGREIMRAIILKARARRNIRIWQNSVTIDLVTHEGKCRGVLVWDRRRGFALVWARAVVLATGGAGQLYRETTNPPIATGDGHAMAYRAGAELRDMEFMQFHPTVLYLAGSTRHLLTEALRGEGAYLRDRFGERFMPAYHPLAELAPRDDVSLAIAAQMAKTQHPNVYLDLSHLDPESIRSRFPGIDRLCRTFDLDITHDPIPVCPGAHYMIGGVTVDSHGRTTLPGLWAAGEVTSSGLHGANRLASNSLLEGLVYGARVAEDIVAELDRAGPQRARSVAGLGAVGRREPGQDRPRRSDQVAARAHVAAHGHHPRCRRAERGRPPGRSLGPLYPAAGIPRPVGLDHAKHADRRPADDRGRPGARGIARGPLPPRLSPGRTRR